MSEVMFTRIESERLILRRFEDSDLIPFVAYRNDPEVARYQSWDSCDEQEAMSSSARWTRRELACLASGLDSPSNRKRWGR